MTQRPRRSASRPYPAAHLDRLPKCTDPARTPLQVPLRGTCDACPGCRPVKFTITALEGGRRDVAKANVDAIVRYLQPAPLAAPSADPDGPEGPSR